MFSIYFDIFDYHNIIHNIFLCLKTNFVCLLQSELKAPLQFNIELHWETNTQKRTKNTTQQHV